MRAIWSALCAISKGRTRPLQPRTGQVSSSKAKTRRIKDAHGWRVHLLDAAEPELLVAYPNL
jgi:hypothetical protein